MALGWGIFGRNFEEFSTGVDTHDLAIRFRLGTLVLTTAEDRATLGSDLSADCGARPGRSKLVSLRYSVNLEWHEGVKSWGFGGEAPITK